MRWPATTKLALHRQSRRHNNMVSRWRAASQPRARRLQTAVARSSPLATHGGWAAAAPARPAGIRRRLRQAARRPARRCPLVHRSPPPCNARRQLPAGRTHHRRPERTPVIPSNAVVPSEPVSSRAHTVSSRAKRGYAAALDPSLRSGLRAFLLAQEGAKRSETLLAHREELVLALAAQGVGIEVAELVEGVGDHLADAVDLSGARWAPPIGSGITSSITSSFFRSAAVTFIASAASCALALLRHRIEAQPSGEITE